MPLYKKIDTFDVDEILKQYTELENNIVWRESSRGKQAGIQYKEGENPWESAVGKFKDRTEESYSLLNPFFKDTIFEEIIKKHNLIRTRLMWVFPMSCYSFHNDVAPRIHYPLITDNECYFLFKKGELIHFPAGEVWWVDTRFKHTFLNASNVNRLHIVGVVKR
jgi:hypothetical protein